MGADPVVLRRTGDEVAVQQQVAGTRARTRRGAHRARSARRPDAHARQVVAERRGASSVVGGQHQREPFGRQPAGAQLGRDGGGVPAAVEGTGRQVKVHRRRSRREES